MKNDKKLEELKSKQKVDLILANPIFHTKVRILRMKWKIPPNGFTLKKSIEIKTKKGIVRQHVKGKMEKWEDRLNESGKSPDFWKDLDNLRKTTLKPYKLPDRWLLFLQWYIVYGSKMPVSSPEIYLRRDDDASEYTLWVKIDGDTTLSDIKRVWKYIKGEQKRLFDYKKRFKAMPKIQRDKRIMKLSKQGLSDKEIAEQINKDFGRGLIYSDIPKIRQKYKKRYRL